MPKKNKGRILKKVLKNIVPKPSEKKRLEELAEKILEIASKEAEKYDAEPIIAGSLTRDTWLPGKMEFDLFIMFPKSTSKANLEKHGLKIGKSIVRKMKGKHIIEYAEHPYVCGIVKNMHIDIVPCYKLNSTAELKSSVDRTPFHVRYIEKNLPKRMANDVRLLKQLCGAYRIYGADTKTEGFSGYVCELIIVRYGSFIKAMHAISKWESGEVIDIEKFYKEKDHARLKRKFKAQSLILIDPTDANRNTAAAISHENFQKLIKITNEFQQSPSEQMFFPKRKKPMTITHLKRTLKERDTEIIVIKFRPPKVVSDILWPQLRRFANRTEAILKENEFVVLRKGVYTNEKNIACVLLEMKNCRLPAIQKRIGPSVSDKDGSKNFICKYKKTAITGPFVEKGFWVVETKRKFRTAQSKLKDSLGDSVRTLKAKGIPSHIAKQVAKRYTLLSDSERIIKIVKKDKEFGIFLREYFEKERLDI